MSNNSMSPSFSLIIQKIFLIYLEKCLSQLNMIQTIANEDHSDDSCELFTNVAVMVSDKMLKRKVPMMNFFEK